LGRGEPLCGFAARTAADFRAVEVQFLDVAFGQLAKGQADGWVIGTAGGDAWRPTVRTSVIANAAGRPIFWLGVGASCAAIRTISPMRFLANCRAPACALLLGLALTGGLGATAQDAAVAPEIFEKDVRPLIGEYCLKCHSAKKQKGDLDLEQFASLAAVRKQPKIWQSVAEQLANKEMPPKDKPQPAPAERARLAQWVDAMLDEAALARAGDPGPVVLRRLSNAEYTYTLRDLTGVESLDPAREFPVDGAAGEGFTNTGSALVMSPSLLVKYLDAAKEIASHAVLLPDGLRFSPATTRRDWTEEILAQIRAFYREFTDAGGGEKVKAEGAGMVNSDGGRIALERYFAATLAERAELRGGSKTAQSVAQERGLNPKYLAALFAMLEAKEPSLLLDGIRARWRGAKPAEAAALAAEVARWQKALWKFGSVGHIGKVGGPKAWMEAVSPFAAKQELRLKLPPSPDGQDVTIYLAAFDAGDGNESDFVVWQQPRLVAKGRPDLLLRDVPAVSNQLAGRFGRQPNGQPLDAASLGVRAPAVLAIHLPFDVAAGCEFVTTGMLDPATGAEGSVQLRALTTKPEGVGLQASTVETKAGAGSWGEQKVAIATPIIATEGSAARKRMESAFEAFRQIFPAALCYTKIVPVDEVVTLTLFHREDEPLARLMLHDAQRARLDRLWDELRYVSQDALTLVDAFEQIWQFSTQDGPNAPQGDQRLEPMRAPINARAAAFKQRLVDTQPRHLDAVLEFANRAYRRPLTAAETAELRGLYRKLRAEELPHEDAIRLTLARVLVAPAFLYRLEKAAPGSEPGPVSDHELATRLSYFLWSSAPDAELRALAAAGKLREPAVLAAQTRRMLRDPRVRRLATEFACQWMYVRDFDHLDEKSDRHFPTFIALRGAMYEESRRFFTDLFQRDGAVTDILDADYTFLRAARQALRHPRRDRRSMAARGRHEETGPRRHPRSGDDAGEELRRVAHQPDPARQLGRRSAARRPPAEAAEGRAASARGGKRRHAHRPPTHRETQRRPALRRLPCAHRSVRLRARRLRRHRSQARKGSRRPPHRHESHARRRHAARRSRWSAHLSAHHAPPRVH